MTRSRHPRRGRRGVGRGHLLRRDFVRHQLHGRALNLTMLAVR